MPKAQLALLLENIDKSRSATTMSWWPWRTFFYGSKPVMCDLQQRIAASFQAQGLMETLGAKLIFVADGEVHIALPFSKHLSQQHGFMHAGAIASIVDNACGYAALTKAPADHEVVTAEFKINFLRPALGKRFLAVGKVQNAGRMLTVCSGEVRAFAGGEHAYKVVALMQATIANVRSTAQPPRLEASLGVVCEDRPPTL